MYFTSYCTSTLTTGTDYQFYMLGRRRYFLATTNVADKLIWWFGIYAICFNIFEKKLS